MRRALIAAAVSCAATAALAQALNFPALSGRVVDDAGILEPALRDRLTQKLAALETKNTDQVVVATVKSLQGTTVEVYANALFKQWRLGQADKNNGVLLLVAPNERRVRIEVGSGLGSRLSDATAKAIIDNSILPRFRAGDFPDGIERGVDAIVQALSGTNTWRIRVGTRRGGRAAARRRRGDPVHDFPRHVPRGAAARSECGMDRFHVLVLAHHDIVVHGGAVRHTLIVVRFRRVLRRGWGFGRRRRVGELVRC